MHPKPTFSLIAKKHDLIAIAVTDPYELDFPKMEMVTMKDLESGLFEIIDTSDPTVHATFKQQGLEKLNDLNQLMKKIGAGFINIRTDEPYLKPMHKFFKLREIKH